MKQLTTQKKVEEKHLIRPELNLEKWSLFATSQYKGRSREIFRQIETGKTIGVKIGKQIDDKGNTLEVGVLRVLDLKGFYGLIKLWEETGKLTNQLVKARMRQLARILKKSWGGKTNKELKMMLQRLRRIPIDWVASFYHKKTNTIDKMLAQVNILTDLRVYEREKGKKIEEAAFAFKFHDVILQNLINNHTKPLNLNVILGFKKELSMFLYRHVDLIMADKLHYQRTTKNLISDIGLEIKSYPYPSLRKQVLQPALRELKGVRLSTGTLTYARLHRTANNNEWKVVFKKDPLRPLLEVETEGHRTYLRPNSKKQVMDYKVQALIVEDILRVLRDEKSRAFYTKIAKLCPQDMIYRALSEIKQDYSDSSIRKSRGAIFTEKIKRYSKEAGIDLRLSSPNKDLLTKTEKEGIKEVEKTFDGVIKFVDKNKNK